MNPIVLPSLVLLSVLLHAEGIVPQAGVCFRLSRSDDTASAQALTPGGPEEAALLGVLSRHVFRSEVVKPDVDDRYNLIQRMTESLADHFMALGNPAARRSIMQAYAHAPVEAIGLVEPVHIIHVVVPWSGAQRIQLQDSSGHNLWVFSPWGGELRKVER